MKRNFFRLLKLKNKSISGSWCHKSHSTTVENHSEWVAKSAIFLCFSCTESATSIGACSSACNVMTELFIVPLFKLSGQTINYETCRKQPQPHFYVSAKTCLPTETKVLEQITNLRTTGRDMKCLLLSTHEKALLGSLKV